MGEEEKLRPHDEPPSEDMDSWVTQEMVNLGFQLHRIQYMLTNT